MRTPRCSTALWSWQATHAPSRGNAPAQHTSRSSALQQETSAHLCLLKDVYTSGLQARLDGGQPIARARHHAAGQQAHPRLQQAVAPGRQGVCRRAGAALRAADAPHARAQLDGAPEEEGQQQRGGDAGEDKGRQDVFQRPVVVVRIRLKGGSGGVGEWGRGEQGGGRVRREGATWGAKERQQPTPRKEAVHLA